MCSLPVPEGTRTYFRSVLDVMWDRKRVAYAYHRNGVFRIEGVQWICDAMHDGKMKAEYRFGPNGQAAFIELFSLSGPPKPVIH